MNQELIDAFLHFGENSTLESDVTFSEPNKIWIGSYVLVRRNVSLALHQSGNKKQKVRLLIGDRAYIGKNCTLESFNQVVIGEDTLVGPDVYISDTQHEYSDPYLPISIQGFKSLDSKLIIQRGAWIGVGSRLIGNITIGSGSVIGANTVITKNVPSHCVVVGNPAKIVKIFDYKKNEWLIPQSSQEIGDILENRGKFSGYDDKFIVQTLRKRVGK